MGRDRVMDRDLVTGRDLVMGRDSVKDGNHLKDRDLLWVVTGGRVVGADLSLGRSVDALLPHHLLPGRRRSRALVPQLPAAAP